MPCVTTKKLLAVCAGKPIQHKCAVFQRHHKLSWSLFFIDIYLVNSWCIFEKNNIKAHCLRHASFIAVCVVTSVFTSVSIIIKHVGLQCIQIPLFLLFCLLCVLWCSLGDSSPHESMENWVDEKRQRREIANSNERRRMQSINSGFQSLRTLLPQCEGEKLSKV